MNCFFCIAYIICPILNSGEPISSKHLMLTNDKKARLVAGKNGIAVLNISAFLLACKSSNFLDKNQIAGIVADLKQKDYFAFSKDELEKIY